MSYAICGTGIFVHGYRTNGMVESANWRFKDERAMTVLFGLESICLKVGSKITERRNAMATWGNITTGIVPRPRVLEGD